MVKTVAEADVYQGLTGQLAAVTGTAVGERHLDLLDGGEPRQKVEALEDEADPTVPDRGEGVITEGVNRHPVKAVST